MKHVIFLILATIFVFASCTDQSKQTEEPKGKQCSYYTDCKSSEICYKAECVAADSYSCKESGLCPKDLTCSQLSGKCKPVSCTNHSECGEGQFCNGNVCKSTCQNELDCGIGYTCTPATGECDLKSDVNCLTNPEICTENQVCNTETKECVNKEDKECTNDFECDYENGQYCNTNNNKCEMDPNYCVDDNACETNFECKAHKCEPIGGTSCSIEEECENGLHCNNGDGGTNTCVQCLEDAHCVDGTCDLSTKKCIIVQSCTDDSTCPDGTKCVMPDGMMPGLGGATGGGQGTCQEVEVCYIDADCNPEDTDPENFEKFCKRNQGVEDSEPGYCATKNNFDQGDLTSGFLDSLGICVDIPGVDFLKCPEGQECVDNHCSGGSGGNCNDALGIGRQNCEANGGTCNADGECVGAAEPECHRDSDCTDLYPDRENQICQRGGCVTDPTPRCPNGDSDCTDQMHCDSSDQICYSCVVDNNCGNGSVCRDHNCVNSSFCTDDSDCSDGMVCRANICR